MEHVTNTRNTLIVSIKPDPGANQMSFRQKRIACQRRQHQGNHYHAARPIGLKQILSRQL